MLSSLDRESIVHQLKLEEQAHEEDLRREKMTKMAEIKVRYALTQDNVILYTHRPRNSATSRK